MGTNLGDGESIRLWWVGIVWSGCELASSLYKCTHWLEYKTREAYQSKEITIEYIFKMAGHLTSSILLFASFFFFLKKKKTFVFLPCGEKREASILSQLVWFIEKNFRQNSSIYRVTSRFFVGFVKTTQRTQQV